MSGNFEVQEYKKPEYEVRVTPAKPRVLEGESAFKRSSTPAISSANRSAARK